MKQIVIVSLLLMTATSAWARKGWQRVEKLHRGDTILVTTETTKSCVFGGADEQSVTCGGHVLARADVQRISLVGRNGHAMRWGGRIGAVVGAGGGASAGAAGGWRGSLAVGALLLPVGFLAGMVAGELFEPGERVIYVHP